MGMGTRTAVKTYREAVGVGVPSVYITDGKCIACEKVCESSNFSVYDIWRVSAPWY
jgi:hypothetical protein